jgi:protein O-mannosyl-transferase
MQPFFWLLALMTITVLIYLPGINGPFLFDDAQNIVSPIQAWLDGRTGWQDIVFGNRSGLFGRPLPMATFLANAALSGLAAMPFKATNIAIHIICSILIYKLIFALLQRDPLLGSRAKIYALLVCALWLLHPMQVSTVLYIVQRMAQLSTL